MPQTLKDDVRDRIEQAALDIMLEKGIEACDMRSIARKSGCTTGNLYRYFKNKDRLILSLIKPLTDKLNEVISRQTHGEITLLGENMKLSVDKTARKPSLYLRELLEEKIYNVLVQLGAEGRKHRKRMGILLNSRTVSDGLINWAAELIKNSFYQCFDVNEGKKNADTMIYVFVHSFCQGILQLLQSEQSGSEEIYNKMVGMYLDMQLTGLCLLIDKALREGYISASKDVFV